MLTGPHLYRAFGLRIASEIPLQELNADPDGSADIADLLIRRRPVAGPIPGRSDEPIANFVTDTVFFAWHRLGRFLLHGTSVIEVDAVPGVEDGLLSIALLGPILATVLHRRGHLLLHGSAIDAGDGRALLFLGDKRAGKSTLAAAFVRAGHDLISDDLAVIDIDEKGGFRILRGFPSIKLERETIEALGPLPATRLTDAPPEAPKARLKVDQREGFDLQIGQIHILTRGPAYRVQRLPHDQALGALLRYSYMMKFGRDAFPGNEAAQHFGRCARIAQAVPVSSLSIAHNLEKIDQSVEAILADVNRA